MQLLTYFHTDLAKVIDNAAQIKPKEIGGDGMSVSLDSEGKVSANAPPFIPYKMPPDSNVFYPVEDLRDICIIDIAHHTGFFVFLTSTAKVIIARIQKKSYIAWNTFDEDTIDIDTNYNTFVPPDGFLDDIPNVIKHLYHYDGRVILYYLLLDGTVVRKDEDNRVTSLSGLTNIIDMIRSSNENDSPVFLTSTGEIYTYNDRTRCSIRISIGQPSITNLIFGSDGLVLVRNRDDSIDALEINHIH